MDTTSRTPIAAAAGLTRNTVAFAPSGRTSSSSSSRARSKDILPTLNYSSSSSKDKASRRGVGSFKLRKEGQGLVGVLIDRVQSSYSSGRRLLPWLLLALVWGYIGFHMQNRWSVWQEIGDLQPGGDGGQSLSALAAASDYNRGSSTRLSFNKSEGRKESLHSDRREKVRGWLKDWLPQRKGNVEQENRSREDLKSWTFVTPAKRDNKHNNIAKGEDRPTRYPSTIGNSIVSSESEEEGIVAEEGDGSRDSDQELHIQQQHHHGRIVGPFDETERQVLGRSSRSSSSRRQCSRKGLFPDFVRGKSIVMVFHELSMTGAPLAVLELATEIVNCGGRISAVVLNKKGGLYRELVQRGIAIVRDKLSSSWKAAARADLVVAGSAACNTWIGQYLQYNKKGGERLIWWLMENRREYYDRSRPLLAKAHALVFLSETQKQLWQQWASEDRLTLPSLVEVINLSVNDGLASIAGLDDESESAGSSGKEALKRRETLRNQVRKEMGLESSDFLVISLSSINPGKGQLMMLQAALMVAEGIEDEGLEGLARIEREGYIGAGAALGMHSSGNDKRRPDGNHNLKVLLGSVGSKSNKPSYLEKIRGLIDRRPILANMLLWTEATVHVGPLYAAADAYVMNAQGIGETFGRVTIEAMAFGLPVLGTDAGGTKEIIEPNVTGLLHPAGELGIPVLARQLGWLLSHPEMGVEMGEKGRNRVCEMFREGPMYEAMAKMFIESVRERGG